MLIGYVIKLRLLVKLLQKTYGDINNYKEATISCSKTQSENTEPVTCDSNIALAVTLKLPVYIKFWYILDWINEVPHYRCGTSASQICKRVAPGHFYFYYSFMLYFQFQRDLYVPRVSYGIPRGYCYCLVLNTCQPVI